MPAILIVSGALALKTSLYFLLFLLLLPSGYVISNEDSTEQKSPAPQAVTPANSFVSSKTTEKDKAKTEKEGKIIWLTKKIAPTARWVSTLVTPLSTWIEKKIQRSRASNEKHSKRTNIKSSLSLEPLSNKTALPTLTPTQATQIATTQFPGEILLIKLLSFKQSAPHYKVKLISSAGEIHILYINAHTGELTHPDKEQKKG